MNDFLLYPGFFEDDDIPDANGVHTKCYSLLNEVKSKFEVILSKNPDEGGKISVTADIMLNKDGLGYFLAELIQEEVDRLLQLFETCKKYRSMIDEEIGVLNDIGSQYEIKPQINGDAHSLSNLLLSRSIASTTISLLSAAKAFISDT